MRRALTASVGALVREPVLRHALLSAEAGPPWAGAQRTASLHACAAPLAPGLNASADGCARHAACGWRAAASQALLLPQQPRLPADGAARRSGGVPSRGWAANTLPQTAAFATMPRSGVTPPAAVAGMQRGGVRVVMVSPNVVAEPYQGQQRWLPVNSLFTGAGWRELRDRVVGRLKSVYAIAKVKKDVPNWSLATFKAEAIELYKEVCTAIAAGDHASLRHKATESLLTNIKRELKHREAGGWTRVKWELVEVLECAVVHGRLVAPNPKDTTNSWAQLTVALKSTQRFSAYDARGKMVAGDPTQLLQVQDYWVFERAIIAGMPDGMKKWRCAARLTLPASR